MEAEADAKLDELIRARIAAGGLDSSEKAPEAAAEIARQLIVERLKAAREADERRRSVVRVCRGVMGGMLLINKNLPDTAVSLLKASSLMAQDLNLDTMEMMTWCLEGIAGIIPVAPPDARPKIADRIEENFMGAGEIFGNFCDAASARKT